MRLKILVAASLSAFAFVSLLQYPVFAAVNHAKNSKNNTKPDYKGEVAQIIEAPTVSLFDLIYTQMSQNTGRGTKGSADWFSRIRFGGGLNFDAHTGNRSMGYNGENVQGLSLNDAYLNANANINDWTKVFLSVNYNNASPQNGIREGMYDSASRPYRLNLNQGYITLANFHVWPVFLQLGKQYTDYGRYTLFPITRSLTQVMTESLQTSAKLGFIAPVFGDMGFNGQVYAFDPSLTQTGLSHKKNRLWSSIGFIETKRSIWL